MGADEQAAGLEPQTKRRAELLDALLPTAVRNLRTTMGETPEALAEKLGITLRTKRGASEATSVEAPRDLDRFVLRDVIARGGMGVVHRATQVSLGRDVAVKVPATTENRSTIVQLVEEARLTGELDHPNILPVYDVAWDTDSRPMIAMKRIEGLEWREVMNDAAAVRDRFGVEDLLGWNIRILIQLCNAVHFAHSRNIIHRDLKPENVMIGRYGEIYLLDWGIAMRVPVALDSPDDRAEPRVVVGTLGYMAPEMLLLDRKALSPATDVYLLGAILYQILAGKPPHQGKKFRELAESILGSEPPLPDGCPMGLRAICRRAMAVRYSDRFASADALRRALEQFLQHRGAAQLAAEGELLRSKLIRLLEQESADPVEHRLAVYRAFAECRYAYRAALRDWSDNGPAKRGLRDAVLAVAEYELARDQPLAAAALAAELEQPAPELDQRIQRARELQQADAQRREKLERLAHNVDVRVGERFRGLVFAAFLGLWIAAPPLIAGAPRLLHRLAVMPHLVACDLGLLVAFLAVSIGLRRAVSVTVANRRIFWMFGVGLSVQTLLSLGAAAANVPFVTAVALHPLVWAATAAAIGVYHEVRMAPTAVIYSVAFLCGALWPAWLPYTIPLSHASAVGNIMLVWHLRQRAASG